MSSYQRNLPHWQPERAALFITWRLHGSTPRNVEFLEPPHRHAQFIVNLSLNQTASGPRWLNDPRIAQCVVDTLFFGERQLGLYSLSAWALIVNHVHILIQPHAPLARITKAIKNYSARRANLILGRTGLPFWRDESYDHWIRNPDEYERVVRYIEHNPVAAGLVTRMEDWPWSSARLRP